MSLFKPAKKYDLVCIINKGTSDWVLGNIARKVAFYAGDKSITYIQGKRKLPNAECYFYSSWFTYVKSFHAKELPKNCTKLVYFTHMRETAYSESEIIAAFNRADKIIFMNSRSMREFIQRGLHAEKAVTIPGAADPQIFLPHQRSGNGAIGLCSAYYERKNPKLIIEILKANPHRNFIMLGKNWAQCKHFQEMQDLNNLLYVQDDYENYPGYYKQIDVFLSPSTLEGGPIPLIEAMMSNIYPIASRTGFAEDIISDGANGLLFDVNSNIDHITKLIDKAFADKVTDIRATTSNLTWASFAANVLSLSRNQELNAMPQKPKVFIHVNDKQIFAAKIAKYTLQKNSAHSDKFDVEFIQLDDYPHLKNKEGKEYLRKGMTDKWKNDDLQSFTPLRFLPPQLMGYQGKAVVVDPDVFGIGDIYELLTRDMGDKAILCRKVADKSERGYYWGTSVMLLDCAKLKHWKWEETIDQLFAKKIDYRDWMSLYLENENTIGEIEEVWNSFDILTPETKLLHNTGRLTQPWKTGLHVDFQNAEKFYKKSNRKRSLIDKILGRNKKQANVSRLPQLYQKHPDQAQIDFFFNYLGECLDAGIVSKKEIKNEIQKGNIRPDVFEVLEQYPSGKQKKAS